MNIPFLDLKKINLAFKDEILQSINSVLDSGYFILGREKVNFEHEFDEFCGTKYSLGIANCLDKLILIIRTYEELDFLTK